MWMFSACIYVKLAEHLVTQLVLRKHAADCMFYNPNRLLLKSISSLHVSVSTNISSIVEVYLGLFLLACQNYLVSVDNNDIVTGVNVWCKCYFILSPKDFCNSCSQTAKRLTFSINDIPFSGNVARIGHKCGSHS